MTVFVCYDVEEAVFVVDYLFGELDRSVVEVGGCVIKGGWVDGFLAPVCAAGC